MNVRELMRSPIAEVSPDTTVGQVAALMVEHGLEALPVVDKQRGIVGLVTESDLVVKHAHIHGPTYLGILGGIIPFETRRRDEEMRRALGTTAADVMTVKFPTVAPDDDVDDAATAMVEHGARTVVVVTGGEVVGLVSQGDIVRLLVAEEGDGDVTPTQ